MRWADSWEPTENLASCPKLISEYWKKVDKEKRNNRKKRKRRLVIQSDEEDDNGQSPSTIADKDNDENDDTGSKEKRTRLEAYHDHDDDQLQHSFEESEMVGEASETGEPPPLEEINRQITPDDNNFPESNIESICLDDRQISPEQTITETMPVETTAGKEKVRVNQRLTGTRSVMTPAVVDVNEERGKTPEPLQPSIRVKEEPISDNEEENFKRTAKIKAGYSIRKIAEQESRPVRNEDNRSFRNNDSGRRNPVPSTSSMSSVCWPSSHLIPSPPQPTLIPKSALPEDSVPFKMSMTSVSSAHQTNGQMNTETNSELNNSDDQMNRVFEKFKKWISLQQTYILTLCIKYVAKDTLISGHTSEEQIEGEINNWLKERINKTFGVRHCNYFHDHPTYGKVLSALREKVKTAVVHIVKTYNGMTEKKTNSLDAKVISNSDQYINQQNISTCQQQQSLMLSNLQKAPISSIPSHSINTTSRLPINTASHLSVNTTSQLPVNTTSNLPVKTTSQNHFNAHSQQSITSMQPVSLFRLPVCNTMNTMTPLRPLHPQPQIFITNSNQNNLFSQIQAIAYQIESSLRQQQDLENQLRQHQQQQQKQQLQHPLQHSQQQAFQQLQQQQQQKHNQLLNIRLQLKQQFHQHHLLQQQIQAQIQQQTVRLQTTLQQHPRQVLQHRNVNTNQQRISMFQQRQPLGNQNNCPNPMMRFLSQHARFPLMATPTANIQQLRPIPPGPQNMNIRSTVADIRQPNHQTLTLRSTNNPGSMNCGNLTGNQPVLQRSGMTSQPLPAQSIVSNRNNPLIRKTLPIQHSSVNPVPNRLSHVPRNPLFPNGSFHSFNIERSHSAHLSDNSPISTATGSPHNATGSPRNATESPLNTTQSTAENQATLQHDNVVTLAKNSPTVLRSPLLLPLKTNTTITTASTAPGPRVKHTVFPSIKRQIPRKTFKGTQSSLTERMTNSFESGEMTPVFVMEDFSIPSIPPIDLSEACRENESMNGQDLSFEEKDPNESSDDNSISPNAEREMNGMPNEPKLPTDEKETPSELNLVSENNDSQNGGKSVSEKDAAPNVPILQNDCKRKESILHDNDAPGGIKSLVENTLNINSSKDETTEKSPTSLSLTDGSLDFDGNGKELENEIETENKSPSLVPSNHDFGKSRDKLNVPVLSSTQTTKIELSKLIGSCGIIVSNSIARTSPNVSSPFTQRASTVVESIDIDKMETLKKSNKAEAEKKTLGDICQNIGDNVSSIHKKIDSTADKRPEKMNSFPPPLIRTDEVQPSVVKKAIAHVDSVKEVSGEKSKTDHSDSLNVVITNVSGNAKMTSDISFISLTTGKEPLKISHTTNTEAIELSVSSPDSPEVEFTSVSKKTPKLFTAESVTSTSKSPMSMSRSAKTTALRGSVSFVPDNDVPKKVQDYLNVHYQTVLEKLGDKKEKLGNKLHVHEDGSIAVQLSDGECVRIRYKDLIKCKYERETQKKKSSVFVNLIDDGRCNVDTTDAFHSCSSALMTSDSLATSQVTSLSSNSKTACTDQRAEKIKVSNTPLNSTTSKISSEEFKTIREGNIQPVSDDVASTTAKEKNHVCSLLSIDSAVESDGTTTDVKRTVTENMEFEKRSPPLSNDVKNETSPLEDMQSPRSPAARIDEYLNSTEFNLSSPLNDDEINPLDTPSEKIPTFTSAWLPDLRTGSTPTRGNLLAPLESSIDQSDTMTLYNGQSQHSEKFNQSDDQKNTRDKRRMHMKGKVNLPFL